MDVGATLRNARERRGLSIESLARITRIKPGLLLAIESDAFDKVPGGIFLRGFLRSYAREVGLDPEAVVRWYAEEFEAAPEPPAVVAPPPRDPLADLPRPSIFNVSWLRPQAVNAQWAAVAIIVTAFVAYTILAPRLGARGSRSAATVAPAGQAKAQAETAPHQEAAAVGTTGSVLQVDIAPTGPCWISATADGQRAEYGLLQSGDHRAITAHDGLVLRVGDPGTFRYTINGAPGRSLGRPAEPVTVTIDRENAKSFTAR